jgi:hypothetical protein
MRIITIAALAGFAIAPMGALAQTPLQQENAVWTAFKDKKADAFKAMFAPNYVGVYEDGTYDVAKELQNLKNAKISSVKLDNFSGRMIDPNDLLTTYVATVKGSMGKQDISGRYNSASLWHRSGNKWLTVYHTEIKAK